ncbi:MAG: SAM-dependent methyltransferase [Rhodobacteraceae bacterium]|nr:SAM-dependent methyltransferase [Paracoccaceae bacterium]MAY45040.1 SAM-dependent methyltransferase [Paracoccaceae bacterium]
MWDERFSTSDFVFGTAPAAYLVAAADHLDKGSRVLCVADGEGRNSVYLAGLGHEVTAFDASAVGIEKAKGLAAKQGVSVDYRLSGVEDWDWTRPYDAVVAIFIQFMPPDMRARIFDGLRQAVRPGGLLLLHGYAPRQVEYGTGGPRQVQNMYTTDLLQTHFGDWDILRLEDYDADLDEGTGHSGRSGLVDLIARRPVA